MPAIDVPLGTDLPTPSAWPQAGFEEAQLRAAARPFFEANHLAADCVWSRLPGGANNRVYKVESHVRRMLLKVYFRHPQDTRDRLAAESAFLAFAWQQGLRCVPQPMAFDRHAGLGLFSFLEGRKLTPSEIGSAEVLQAADFLVALNRDRDALAMSSLPIASEACFSVAEHIATIERRVQRVEGRTGGLPDSPAIAQLIHHELRPAWNEIRDDLEQQTTLAGRTGQTPFTEPERWLSPSDLGYHNALVDATGQLSFLDFEYAGWDDPAKTICDFFCQPAIPVAGQHYPEFVERLTPVLIEPRRTLNRAALLLPAIRVKWCCIMLNRLLPEGTARREFADAVKPINIDAIRQVLATARQCLPAVP